MTSLDASPTPPTPPTAPKKGNRWLTGCLVFVVVAVVLFGAAGYFVYRSLMQSFITAVETEIAPQMKRDIETSNLPEAQKEGFKAAVDRVVLDLKEGRISPWDRTSWIGSGRDALKEAVLKWDLPDAQKTGINAQVDRLATLLIEDGIDEKQGEAIMRNLTEGPMGMVMGTWAIKAQHVYPSTLNDAAKAHAERQLDRVARGIVERTIDREALFAKLEPYTEIDPETGERQLKEKLTEAELTTLIQTLEAEADAAGVPDEPYVVDYAGELKKAIDAGLEGRTLAPAAPPEAVTPPPAPSTSP